MADADDSTTSRIVSVFAGCDRRDRWWLAQSTALVSAFARSHLDLRDVVTDPDAGVIDMTVLCVFGSVTIVVPEGTDVTLSGTSLLASSSSLVAAGDGESTLPRLVITATTALGRVRVQTTPAERRRRREEPVAETRPVAQRDDGDDAVVDGAGASARAPGSPAGSEVAVAVPDEGAPAEEREPSTVAG